MTSLPSAIANRALAKAAPKEAAVLNEEVKEEAKDKAKEKETIKEADKERFLLQAFHSFAEAAGSLERSYGSLRSEVARLHGELAQSNAGLARSLAENRQMRRHLDRILEGLPCGVLVARPNGVISLVNPEGRRLLGSAIESLSVVPAELRDLFDRARSGAGEQEQCFADGEGRERWLAARHAAVEDADGGNEISAVGDEKNAHTRDICDNDVRDNGVHEKDRVSIFILRDVSEAKRMVREREKLRREQALAEMSAILAHEIRNPLGSLELFAGLLAEAGLSPECRQWVEHVQAGLRTLAATVNNVLHFHSLPAPERVPTDLGRLLDWAGGFLVPMAHRARVELCMRNRLQGVWFTADRHRLEQVLLNLVLNALRAMPGGGWVEVAGHRIHDGDAAAAAISVSDTGPGIHPEQAAKIFEAGFSTHAGSPGLGLAVCRKIVEQHGGSLAAANRAGAGASFTLTFPLREEMSRNGFREEVAG
jgi:two-component system sensor histidine kinase FlrB